MPTGAFNNCCPRDCVSRHNGGTRGSPIMPRDAVSRTAIVERTGRHKWVKGLQSGGDLRPKWEKKKNEHSLCMLL